MSASNRQQGLTLIELMISIALATVVVLGITGLVISSKSAGSTQHEASIIQDTARFALDNISRSIKQAGYVNFDQDDAPFIHAENRSPSIIGIDAASLKATSQGIDLPIKKPNNSSDILALRFFGSGISTDYTVVNCAGFGVPAPNNQSEVQSGQGWSIYYVADDVDQEPALFCKYNASDDNTKFSAQAIARGVESFQVLYGIDTGQFQSATEINTLDSNIPDTDLNQKTHWKKITAIKIAMLIRGAEDASLDPSTTNTYHLFGEGYSNGMGSMDQGTQIKTAEIPLSQRSRPRKVVSTTIQLRNPID